MDNKIKSLVNRIREHLNKIYGERIKKIILYGSYARGEFTKDSDIDILVLVDDSISPFEIRKSLSDIIFDILMEDGELFSVVALPESFFENHHYPFILNVRKEGIIM